jgi:hypothetical protein
MPVTLPNILFLFGFFDFWGLCLWPSIISKRVLLIAGSTKVLFASFLLVCTWLDPSFFPQKRWVMDVPDTFWCYPLQPLGSWYAHFGPDPKSIMGSTKKKCLAISRHILDGQMGRQGKKEAIKNLLLILMSFKSIGVLHIFVRRHLKI